MNLVFVLFRILIRSENRLQKQSHDMIFMGCVYVRSILSDSVQAKIMPLLKLYLFLIVMLSKAVQRLTNQNVL